MKKLTIFMGAISIILLSSFTPPTNLKNSDPKENNALFLLKVHEIAKAIKEKQLTNQANLVVSGNALPEDKNLFAQNLGFKDFESFKKEMFAFYSEYKDREVKSSQPSAKKTIELCEGEAYALGYSACTGYFLYLVSLNLSQTDFMLALLGYTTCLANVSVVIAESLLPPC
ncbi:MAG: hypothetical protein K2X48_02420 [Chitinophagaceae bacterium]|nr:hypothetical protein [Chitinophagaceae bacterium]